ncbi:MAG TPA: RecX family transcriptional regulator [Micromonosporaceae bacterium]|nr:RecX family transcriptional regulator [Micromonosporaceae bacterium]
MAERRRGARSGRGWDAIPPRVGGEPTPRAGEVPTPHARGARAPRAGDPAPRSSGARRGVRRPDAGPDDAAGPAPWSPDPTMVPAPQPPAAERARQICLDLLADRPRTRAELAAALRQKGIADDVAAEVLGRYEEVGIVDDAAFARAWVASRHHSRGLARRALAGELRRRGVDSGTVGEALTEIDGTTEEETARQLAARRLRSLPAGDPAGLLRRLVGMLARKGYPPGLAYRVVQEALVADARTAELAELIDVEALADAAEEGGRTVDDVENWTR